MSEQGLSLYHLETELMALLDTADVVEGEDQRLAIMADIAEANAQAVQKRRNVRAFILWLGGQQDLCKAEMERIQKIKAHLESTEKRVRRYVAGIIEQFAPEAKRGSKKLECEPGTLGLAQNPASVEITDESTVPAAFRRYVFEMGQVQWDWFVANYPGEISKDYLSVTINRSAIKEVLKAGEDVPGASLKYGDLRLVVK